MSGYLIENELPVEELEQIDIFFKLRDYILLSTIIEKDEVKLNGWDEKLLNGALERVFNNKPLVDIDVRKITKQLV